MVPVRLPKKKPEKVVVIAHIHNTKSFQAYGKTLNVAKNFRESAEYTKWGMKLNLIKCTQVWQ
jgi:Icc-related predicted phosphoesterase